MVEHRYGIPKVAGTKPYGRRSAFRVNGSSQTVVEAFRKHGFKVRWDGKQHSAIEVVLA